MTEYKFKSGDIVFLKSGGPAMTIEKVVVPTYSSDKDFYYYCVWFKGASLERGKFEESNLQQKELKNE